MSKFSRKLLIFVALLAIVLGSRHATAKDALAAATQLYQSSQWQQAAAAFDRVAQDPQQNDATRLAAQLYAGESLVQLGKFAEARQCYDLVHQSAPPAPLAAQALFRLGEAAWLSGKGDEATKLLQAYVEKYPIGASSSYAQTYLQQIRQRHSSQANFEILDEAVGWERDGRHNAALAAYRKILEQHPSRDPTRAETLRRTAKLHDRLKQSREAIGLYQQFLTEFPQSEQAAEVMQAVAWLYDRLDQTTQAADQFRGVHAKFPQSAQAAEAAYWLALAHADKQEHSEAMQYVDWLLSRKNGSGGRTKLLAKALCLKCQLLSKQGQWQQIDEMVESAAKDWSKDLDGGPLRAKLDFWAAEAAFRLKQYETAKDRFTALQPRMIGMGKSWTAMVPLRRAQLAARRQQWGEVLKILDLLERNHPEFELDYEIDYLRGRALAGRGNMTAARKFYRRVLDNRAATETEAVTMAGWMIGETYFHQRDYARARSAYEKVMEKTSLSEWQSRAALQAGKCWELQQRWDEAANVYTTALKSWPNSNSDQELKSRLRWAQSQSTQRR